MESPTWKSPFAAAPAVCAVRYTPGRSVLWPVASSCTLAGYGPLPRRTESWRSCWSGSTRRMFATGAPSGMSTLVTPLGAEVMTSARRSAGRVPQPST